MMKSYCLYVFTQPNCPPCDRLKAHVSCLTEAQRASIHYVPLRAPNGNYTALAEELALRLDHVARALVLALPFGAWLPALAGTYRSARDLCDRRWGLSCLQPDFVRTILGAAWVPQCSASVETFVCSPRAWASESRK